MNIVEEILKSDKKPKEKIYILSEKVKKDNKILAELVKYFEVGSIADKGSCIEVMKYVSQEKPEIVLPYLEFVTKHINDDAPKIKWETARVIGNLAQEYSDKVSKAVPKLLLNSKDDGTVVRWSVAFAISEIVKNNSKSQKELMLKINEMIKKEQNNGVKNVYLKAIKSISKTENS